MTEVLDAAPEPRQRSGATAAVLAGVAILTAVGVVVSLWAAASVVHLSDIGDGGLAPVLPPSYWAGVVAVNLAFVLSLTRRSPLWLSCLLLGALVLVIYGGGILVSDVPRGAVSWRHLGIADALTRGPVDPRIDIYFNWPGFFAALATFIEATGLPPMLVAMVAPLVNVALWTLAVAAIVRTFTRDDTVVLVTLWLFLLGNWIDQDYLSPQALGFLLHLSVLAVVLHLLGARAGTGGRLAEHLDVRRRLALLVALLLVGALVASHQLSPVMLAVSLAALTLVRRSWVPWLPVIVALLLVAWLSYPASTYMAGHPVFGAADQSGVIEANLAERVGGSPGHLVVQQVRMGLTASLWLLAAVGAVRLWAGGRRDPRPLVLAVVPFLLLPADSYGGEMLLRVTLFALPFVAYLAARALAPLVSRAVGSRSLRLEATWVVVLVLALTALSAASVAARYGNARFDTFTSAEVAAVERLAEVAPPDTVMVAGASSTPWASEDYVTHTRRSVQSLCREDFAAAACADELRALAYADDKDYGLTLLLTRGNQASLEIQGFMTTQGFERFEQAVRRLPETRLLFENRDARVYHVAPGAPPPTEGGRR